ncbi:diguanylate cyclase domain-containing protein, partial [Kaarinaea lacus]
KLEIDMEAPGPKTLALLNIDAFSSINTAYGIEVGNFVLKTVAKRLSELSNSDTNVYKLSADEFVILSTNSEIIPYMLKSNIRNLLTKNVLILPKIPFLVSHCCDKNSPLSLLL